MKVTSNCDRTAADPTPHKRDRRRDAILRQNNGAIASETSVGVSAASVPAFFPSATQADWKYGAGLLLHTTIVSNRPGNDRLTTALHET